MPVTAKLSRKFYQALGEDVADELVDWFNDVDTTYRTQLHDLNDLNFDRFDAKMGERLAELETRLEVRFSAIDRRFAEIDQRFRQIDERFELIDERFDKIDQRFEQIDQRFDKIDQRFEQIDQRFEQIDQRFEQIDRRLDRLDRRMAALESRMDGLEAVLEAKIDTKLAEGFDAFQDEIREWTVTRENFAAFRAEIAEKLGSLRSDLFRWMFVSWTGLVLVLITANLLTRAFIP